MSKVRWGLRQRVMGSPAAVAPAGTSLVTTELAHRNQNSQVLLHLLMILSKNLKLYDVETRPYTQQ